MWLIAFALWQAGAHRSGVFQSPRVRESSGVVVSRTHVGVLWTHNDSGDGPFIYATDTSGGDRGALRVPRAYAQDWEDLALGPCPRGTPRDCLYIADTGDNTERRPTVTIYAVAEPDPPSGPADTSRSTAVPVTLRVRYEDGPADVEALFLGVDTALYLVSKGRTRGVRLYRLPRTAWGADTLVTALRIQYLPMLPMLVAGGGITGAGRGWDTPVVVRTYSALFLFTQDAGGQLALSRTCRLGNLEAQGEAVAFLDSSTLVLTSEAARRTRGDLHVVRCP